ncbi:MAG: DUF1152 domain-containing protein [Pirellulales bacterium]
MGHTPEILLSRFARPLLLGIGGGYDIFAGLPTYLDYCKLGKEPVLANLSFTRELEKKCELSEEEFGFYAARVRASDFTTDAFAVELGFPGNYFPEFHLSRWFKKNRQVDVPVFAIRLIAEPSASESLGIETYSQALQRIVDRHQCDAIILIDAGVDSLVIGDEEGLGTYAEDFMSLIASSRIGLPTYLQCVGLGTEAGISVDDFLVNYARHRKANGYLGALDWLSGDENIVQYLDAVGSSVPQNSSIHSMIAAAITGEFGNRCPESLKKRGLDDGDVLVHPWMTLAFWFDAATVLSVRRFVAECSDASSLKDLDIRFDAARKAHHLIDDNGCYIGKRPYSRHVDEILLSAFNKIT